MLKSIMKSLALINAGGAMYCFIELLWRGYTHWSMYIVGGLCFFLTGGINNIMTYDMPLIEQQGIACIVITAVEFISGCMLNIGLGMNIWDYTDQFGNIFGQICPLYSLFWYFLSLPAIILDDYLRYELFDEDRPHYKII